MTRGEAWQDVPDRSTVIEEEVPAAVERDF